MSNIRVEVTGHTALYMDIPELTMTGIDNSVRPTLRCAGFE